MPPLTPHAVEPLNPRAVELLTPLAEEPLTPLAVEPARGRHKRPSGHHVQIAPLRRRLLSRPCVASQDGRTRSGPPRRRGHARAGSVTGRPVTAGSESTEWSWRGHVGGEIGSRCYTSLVLRFVDPISGPARPGSAQPGPERRTVKASSRRPSRSTRSPCPHRPPPPPAPYSRYRRHYTLGQLSLSLSLSLFLSLCQSLFSLLLLLLPLLPQVSPPLVPCASSLTPPLAASRPRPGPVPHLSPGPAPPVPRPYPSLSRRTGRQPSLPRRPTPQVPGGSEGFRPSPDPLPSNRGGSCPGPRVDSDEDARKEPRPQPDARKGARPGWAGSRERAGRRRLAPLSRPAPAPPNHPTYPPPLRYCLPGPCSPARVPLPRSVA